MGGAGYPALLTEVFFSNTICETIHDICDHLHQSAFYRFVVYVYQISYYHYGVIFLVCDLHFITKRRFGCEDIMAGTTCSMQYPFAPS